MTDSYLTRIETLFVPEEANYWLCFGLPSGRIDLAEGRALLLFEPAQVLGYVRWQAGDTGPGNWQLTIMKTGAPSQTLSRMPGVSPGADPLLFVTGKRKVTRVLALLETLKDRDFVLEEVSPSYYRHVHNRLGADRNIRPYSVEQHAAHLAAKRVR